MYVLRYESIDGSPPLELIPLKGRSFDVEPLTHAALAAYLAPEGKCQIVLKDVTAVGAQIPQSQRATAKLLVALGVAEPLFGLVESGWIPFPFMSGDIAFVDRNVVSKIENLQVGQTKVQGTPISPQFDLSFAGQLVSPLPYVLEGNFRKTQTHGELRKTLARATKAICRVLPDAQVPAIDTDRLIGIHGLLDDKVRFQRRAAPFLRDVCPSVSQPAGARQQAEVERKILRVAKERGIPPYSFVVLAVLSCLYDNVSSHVHPKVLKPGRAVVKPKLSYSEGDAYATLSDLLFLQFVVLMKSHGLAQKPVFYTHDIGLAAFWSALNPRDFFRDDHDISTAKFTLTSALFPALNEDQRAALFDRLQSQMC